MEGQFQIYKVNQQIHNLVEAMIDQETGEINPVAVIQLNKLEIQKEEAIHQLCLVHLESKAKAEAVAVEIKRLTALKKSLEVREEASKRIIEREVPEGETMQFENAKISYRKSESVEMDDDFDLSQLAFDQPDLVDIKYGLKKDNIKKLVKENKPIPEGIRIVKKNNIQIK